MLKIVFNCFIEFLMFKINVYYIFNSYKTIDLVFIKKNNKSFYIKISIYKNKFLFFIIHKMLILS